MGLNECLCGEEPVMSELGDRQYWVTCPRCHLETVESSTELAAEYNWNRSITSIRGKLRMNESNHIDDRPLERDFDGNPLPDQRTLAEKFRDAEAKKSEAAFEQRIAKLSADIEMLIRACTQNDLRISKLEENQEENDTITKYWMKHFVKDGLCSLCGNHGKIDTTGVKSAAGVECGRVNYCACPNGRAMNPDDPFFGDG